MQPTVRRTSDKPKTKRILENETEGAITKKPLEERLRTPSHAISTPRNKLQTPADIYAQNIKNPHQSTRAPKKTGTTSRSNISPMKNLLKSTPSSVSVASTKTSYEPPTSSRKLPPNKIEAKPLPSARNTKTPKRDLPFTTNVTVNSPVLKRRSNSNLEREKTFETKEVEVKAKSFGKGDSKDTLNESLPPRPRTKTRTLEEDEVKLLKPDVVHNNAALQKLTAKPQAFYVQFGDGDKTEQQDTKSSEEEISYEDDFESYESDFESYHSDKSNAEQHSDEQTEQQSDEDSGTKVEGINERSKDEEKMLDSGSFDLRDQRSASRPPPLQFIVEGVEGSQVDEGFQDMSTSTSNGNSWRHVDVLERSKQNKLRKKISEQLKQRAKDLLSMITLHGMSYALFEIKPIPYDLYMATFGRSNYTQIACQTFEDGISEEMQTDEVLCDSKWIQHPVEFSKNDVYIQADMNTSKSGKNDEDFVAKFTFLSQDHVKELAETTILALVSWMAVL